MKSIKILLKSIFLILFFLSSHSFSEILNKIEIIGNDRVSKKTVKLFIQVDLKDEINDTKLNKILKDLYETGFFKNVSVNFKDKILTINVDENPIIENIEYKGIKSNKILNFIKEDTLIKSRSSYNEIIIKKDQLKIKDILNNLGYYNSNGNLSYNGTSASYGNSYTDNDIIGVALDMDNHAVYFSKNGTFQNSGDPTSGSSKTGDATSTASYNPLDDGGEMFMFVEDFSASGVGQCYVNFGSPAYAISSGNADADGHGNFEYAVPSGYFALCTKNLAEYG